MRTSHALTVSLLAVAFASGCSQVPLTGSFGAAAQARLQPTQGNSAAGTVDFRQRGDDVLVTADISGLTPGSHGFHIHEKGDCSAPDATSAGGHFNPTGKPHGHPMQGEHHVGDLPMLQADASGNARLDTTARAMSLRDRETSIIGRAVVVHAGRDDYQSQPAGDSGARVACGVIRAR